MAGKPPSLIQMFAERAKRLYSPRAVAMEVLKLSHNPQVDAKQITSQIANDPALAARILRVVNSSLFATRDDVVDLDQAVALLGVKTLRLLVLGFAIPDSLFDPQYDEALEAYWRFTAIKAIAAKSIVEVIWRRPSDQAFVAGLLHDLGSLVLLNEVGDEYAEFLAKTRAAGEEVNSLEMDVLGFEHIILSARLLSHWGLPESLTQGIGMPLDVERLAKLPEHCAELPQVLHLADLTARFLMRREPGILRELMQTAKRYRKATAVHVESVVETVNHSEPALLQIFGQQPSGEDYLEVLREAQMQLELSDDTVVEREFWDHERPNFAKLEQRALELAEQAIQRQSEGDFVPEAFPDRAPELEVHGPAEVASVNYAARFAKLNADGDASPSAQKANETDASSAATGLLSAELDLNESGICKRLERWLIRSRRNGVPVSLILLEVDLTRVSPGLRDGVGQRIDRFVAATLRGSAASVSADGFAYVAAMDRRESIEAVRAILRRLESDAHCNAALTKFGIASIEHPPPNYPADEWFQAAQRCLYGAQCAGGNVIKSIDAV